MSFWEALILGIIQGLTEFLPVSSSGHLELASHFFGIEEPSNLQFTMALHAGTVLSTIVVFRKELVQLIAGFFKFRLNEETIFVINIFISLVPILFVGLFFMDYIEGMFTGNLLLVGTMLIVTAALLTYSYFTKPGSKKVTPKSAFIIGLAQAVAVLPGLSRSGSTISAGLIQGIKREEVSKFSFLMVLIPVIGMNLLEILAKPSGGPSIPFTMVATGFLVSFIVGTLACKWMIRLVNSGKLIWFAVYCLIIGSITVIFSLYSNY